jgi:hypothetical protein
MRGAWDVAILSGVESLELASQPVRLGDYSMRTRWLLVFPVTFCITVCAASAQVADIAGVLPGDRWVYEVTDEVSGELKLTTTVFVLDVSEQEINTRVSTRGTGARQIVFDQSWNRIDDSVWKYRPSDGSGIKKPLQVGKAWRFESKATHFQNGTALTITGESKVVGEEKVTTGAATFDTSRRKYARSIPTIRPRLQRSMPFFGMRRALIAGSAGPTSSRSKVGYAVRTQRS